MNEGCWIVLEANGLYIYLLCDVDGYPYGGVGQTLYYKYKDKRKINGLFKRNRDIWMLGDNSEETEYQECKNYDNYFLSESSLIRAFKKSFYGYMYLFRENDWYLFNVNTNTFIKLKEIF